MQVTIISGSPRKGENSERIAKRCEELLMKEDIKVEKIFLSETEILPCIHCDYCKKNYGCSRKDKMNEIYPILEKSDALLVISPTYMGGMTGQAKAFLDRSVSLRRNGFRLKGKLGSAIAVGGSRNGGQEHVVNQVHHAMLIHGMLISGDANHFGGTVEAPFEKDEFGRQTVEDTVKELIENLK